MPVSLKLIVGLGNPGPEHSDTRHNAGFWFLDRLAGDYHVTFTSEDRFFGQLARVQHDEIDCRLFKPQTYMNNSGRAVLSIANYFRILPEQILVAHDEIDLPPGTVRMKQGGGHAGHNGVRDIIETLGSRDFNRLRIGVGHPGSKEQVIGSVLGRPSRADKQLIDAAIDKALELVPLLLAGEFEKVMTRLHTSDKGNEESEK